MTVQVKSGIVYVFTSPEMIKSKMYKVGIVGSSKKARINNRLRQLTCSNPNGKFTKIYSSNDVFNDERAIHSKLVNNGHAKKREWFIVNNDKDLYTLMDEHFSVGKYKQGSPKETTSSRFFNFINTIAGIFKSK